MKGLLLLLLLLLRWGLPIQAVSKQARYSRHCATTLQLLRPAAGPLRSFASLAMRCNSVQEQAAGLGCLAC
jgi:hypothetical protein